MNGETVANDSANWPQDFTGILISDFVEAEKRAHLVGTPGARRDFVRVTFSAIEGLLWQSKTMVADHLTLVPSTSVHERLALLEEAYAVDAKGDVSVRARYVPITTSIRLLIKLVKRYGNVYRTNLSGRGWAALTSASKTRNRIAHPKTLEDLSVSDHELSECRSACLWVLALALEVHHETVEHKKALIQRLSPVIDRGRKAEAI